MSKTAKRSLAMLLVLVQLVTLLPVLSINADAADTDPAVPADAQETPVLNEMITGEFSFQSFNFLGDNATGSDGVDYTSTFYYTDDWFSDSAINENATSTRMNWYDLENVSLAATSFDLTVAAYASNEGNVLRATGRTWDNTDYSDKAKNAREMLEQCGFTNFKAYNYDHAPTNDSIAFVIASKPIHVWDAYTQTNKDFTLLAVAVRGAGYGAEWASNVTIGDKSTNRIGANGRHWGFDTAAQDVCAALQQYLQDNNITHDAKYWITGFSRAGATANLVAGYVTAGAETTYHSHQRDVYGYTWECPQGASTQENALNYKNIHNIINGMDAVPKVSPDSFRHQRLGVDYCMPYYKNTTEAQNESYYTAMREVLKTIAVGAYNYKGESYTEDPLIHITDPSQYPYNRTMRIRTITAGQLISDAIDGVIADNFGTVDATGSAQRIPSQHIDEFIDDLIDVFMVSTVWDRYYSSSTSNIMTHRTRFIETYQPHFRNVLGYLLDFTGPAFLGVIDDLIDAVGDQLALTNTAQNIGVGLAFLNFYNYPTSTYVFPTLGIFNDPWIGKISWRNRSRKEVLIEEAQPVVRNVVRNLTNGFVDPQGITRSQFENSMDVMVELVIDLYADELSRYNSNYFGTTLYYLWQILCTHEQEVVMSWIKSLDDLHMSRGYRTVTLPKGTDAKLYEFRAKYGEVLSETGTAPLVAEFKNGGQVSSLDQRIYMETSGSNMIIRYPAALDIRIDVTTDAAIADLPFAVADYQTKTAATDLSAGGAQYQRLTGSAYTNITNTTSKTNARSVNSASSSYTVPLSERDVFQILANATTTYDNSAAGDSDVYTLNKLVYADVVVEGQFRGDTFYPEVIDRSGERVDVAAATAFLSDNAADGHTGTRFTVQLPTVPEGNTVVKYFTTDASAANLQRLSSDTEAYLPANTQSGSFDTFTVDKPATARAILESSDTVWHVFYGGDFKYTVTWKNADGSVLETDENVPYNAQPSYDGAEPTKQGDDHTVYTFTGWTPEVQPVTADVTYVAQYDETKTCTVTWLNDDGTVLSTTTANEGDLPVYAGETPAKAADAQYTYTFSGWDRALAPVTDDTSYTAVFTGTLNTYTVTFVNFDGAVLQSGAVAYGETPVYTGAAPAKPGDAQYTYTFSGWDSEPAAVTGDAVYTAQFDETVNTYTITWLDMSGGVLGTTEVPYGETPSFEAPEMAPDEQFTYTFEAWVPEVEPVTGDAEYIAIYSMSPRKYTVTWLNDDGTLIDTTEVAYGETPAHADMAKEADEDYLYTFRGWTPAITAVTGDATYTADYNRILRYNVAFQAPDVQDNNNMIPLTGVTDSGAVQQQPNYPSFLGWMLTGVTVSAGDASEVVPYENGEIANAALNAALDRVFAASGLKKAMVTANYAQDTTQTYTVALKYQLPDGTVIDNVTLDPNVVGDAVKLTTGETFTDGENVYWFDHWEVDGKAYKSLSITLRPERAGSYEAIAVYAEGESAANEPVLQVVNAFAEEQNGVAKTAVTLSYGVPEGYTVQAVGFRVSTKDPTLQNMFSLATSKLTEPDGSYTVHINVNTKRDTPVYVCAYLIVTKPDGTTDTILTDPAAYIWSQL